ncbi:MAG: tRNA (adenosine(37)-N6)-threonylcarbamoyltransferase complex transferase subunit TsaD [Spirochaetia bacterium]|nr:tRNA (adenosine(37)-N6)-threonylcarbamoyltransferase complex transferase subunit TsaD [Spirochaetota bacterium]MCX8097174.1 tRNA (adenosine(37)-N6)-threonylcarbamoyltransferase complex transferase subunit TsaD [Spirochaetota bacterium]MDW8112653.1 tRNA (adenosine(37)-N6)-threonylcarbamoyltransferase complex transferase subunit TsaD [Spirochaetia bacterium]
MLVLGIETSCDETSVAIVKNGKEVLSNVVISQIDFHKEFHGVLPEIASRKHLEFINIALQRSLEESRVRLEEIDSVAVTFGPGLLSSLLIGVNVAKTISFFHNKPLIKVDHVEAHLFSPFIEYDVEFPFIGLVVSGAHTNLFIVRDFYNIEMVGYTVDDAVGEAFDKVAKMLGLGYPGGPIIDKLSKEGNPEKFNFPLGAIDKHYDRYNFSYSGLKTSVLYTMRKIGSLDEQTVKDICASFQKSAIDVLHIKTKWLSDEVGIRNIVVAGGVSANSYLRKKFLEDRDIKCYIPSVKYSTDNAAMVASLGYFKPTPARYEDEPYPRIQQIVKGKRKVR